MSGTRMPDDREGAALSLLGLALRAGRAAVGTRAVREAARGSDLHVAVVAADGTSNARRRILPLLRAAGVPWLVCGNRDALGRALGRGPVAVAGVKDRSLGGRLLAMADESSGMEESAGADPPRRERETRRTDLGEV